MLFLLLACKPNTDTHLDTGESLPDCKIQSGEIPMEEAASVIISNSLQPGLYLGSGTSSCDLDGDGHQDLLVSGNIGAQYRGAIGVFYGPATEWPRELDLSEADSLIQGGVGTALLGTTLDCGDLDGDGFGDIVAGTGEAFDGEGIDNDFGIHIWYGSEQRLAPSTTELEADAALYYDYGLEPSYTIHYMNVLVADLDADGREELALAANDSADRESGRDRIFLLEGGRHSSGLLTSAASTIWGLPGKDVVLNAVDLGEPGRALMLDYGALSDPASMVLRQPLGLASESYAEEHSWLDLELGKSTDIMGSTRVITTQDGPIFVTAAWDETLAYAFLLVSETLEEGYVLATDLGKTGESPIVDSIIGAVYPVGDYNGDGVEDLGAEMYMNGNSADPYQAAGVLDGSLLATPGLPLESLLLSSFRFGGRTDNRDADQGFADFDGDRCPDLYLGDMYYSAANDSGQDDGRVFVLLSSRR